MEFQHSPNNQNLAIRSIVSHEIGKRSSQEYKWGWSRNYFTIRIRPRLFLL